MAILALPSVADLAEFSGRPETSYTKFANAAILQATLMFQTVTELQPADMVTMQSAVPEDYKLAILGILSMADYIYLRQPYQSPIATPFISEHIGSYSYSKAAQEIARNAAALEVAGEAVGVTFYDLAVRMLAKRTRAGGVYSGSINVFDEGDESEAQLVVRDSDGRMCVIGPADRDKFNLFAGLDINAESFPHDPGV